jgi:hypothetical protein
MVLICEKSYFVYHSLYVPPNFLHVPLQNHLDYAYYMCTRDVSKHINLRNRFNHPENITVHWEQGVLHHQHWRVLSWILLCILLFLLGHKFHQSSLYNVDVLTLILYYWLKFALSYGLDPGILKWTQTHKGTHTGTLCQQNEGTIKTE